MSTKSSHFSSFFHIHHITNHSGYIMRHTKIHCLNYDMDLSSYRYSTMNRTVVMWAPSRLLSNEEQGTRLETTTRMRDFLPIAVINRPPRNNTKIQLAKGIHMHCVPSISSGSLYGPSSLPTDFALGTQTSPSRLG